jgi:hypothetical protein
MISINFPRILKGDPLVSPCPHALVEIFFAPGAGQPGTLRPVPPEAGLTFDGVPPLQQGRSQKKGSLRTGELPEVTRLTGFFLPSILQTIGRGALF